MVLVALIVQHVFLSLCKKEHNASALAKIARLSIRVHKYTKQCHPLFLIWSKKLFDGTVACVFGAALCCQSLVGRPGQAVAVFRCSAALWNEALSIEQLYLPRRGAGGCLCCCYYGNMPLCSPLCNKVFRFINQNRMKEQLQPLGERKRQRERANQGVLKPLRVFMI